MNASHPTAMRPLGTARLPRQTFVAPAAVRAAQVCLVTRIAFLVGLIFSVGLVASPASLVLPGYGHFTLPDGATWSRLALWILAAAVVEAALVLRIGHLRSGSRRVILFVESMVIAVAGLYTAAGLKLALVPLVWAIAAVVLLRLDHVRHSFDRAHAERRMLKQTIPAVLYQGYAARDAADATPEIQAIGYRVGLDGSPGDARRPGTSRA